MIVLGLTGPSGSGKGVVGRVFQAQNIPVLDTDVVYHAQIEGRTPCTEELASAFGVEILNGAGGVDRSKLAGIVFCGGSKEKERLLRLNAITHRYVIDECHRWLKKVADNGATVAVIDAPLLIESKLHLRCDRVIAVLASPTLRVSRIMARDKLSEEAALARIAAQPTDAFYKEAADFVFVNDGSPQKAEEFVLESVLPEIIK